MTNGNYDWDAFCNITILQQSRNRDDQERLALLLKTFGSTNGWKICANFLLRDHSFDEIYKQSNDLAMKDFFCFRGIEEFINHGYAVENNKELIENMHLFILKWIESYIYEKSSKKENFIRNKCIQIITKLAIIDYPLRWPTFFKDLICILHHSNTSLFVKDSSQKSITHCGNLSFEFFLKFLIYWDCEVCSREVQTNDLIERNTAIKDFMRDNDVSSVMEIINFVITEINMDQPTLFKKALKVASLYISWIDIRFLVTDSVIESIIKPLRNNCDAEDNIKSAALHCLINIINKGMPAYHRLELIGFMYQKLAHNGVWQWIENAKNIPDEIGQEFQCDEDDNDNCFFVTLGCLINTMGIQLIDTYKTLKETKSDQTQLCLHAIYEKMRLALAVTSCQNSVISSTCLSLIQNFISLLKTIYKPEVKKTRRTSRTIAQLNEEEMSITANCLSVLTQRLQYPSWYNFEKEDEIEGNFQQYRRQLLTILTNMIQLNEQIVLKYIIDLLKYSINNFSQLPYQQIETVLKMIYNIADAVKSVKGDYFAAECDISQHMKEIMQLVLSSDLGRHQHAEVRLGYFELLLRYEKYFNHDREFLLTTMYLFLSESGLKSREVRVVSRCVYILSRLIKIHRSKFGDASITILQEISSILHFSFANNSILFCDSSSTINAYSYLYESAATLLVSIEVPDRQQMFHALVEPIVSQVPLLCQEWSSMCLTVAPPTDPRIIRTHQLALALHSAATHINYTCKAFNGSVSMSELNCLNVYMSVLDVFIGNLQCALNTVKSPSAIGRDQINSGLRSLIHMLCKSAQNDPVSINAVLQRLPHAIELFLSHLSLTEQAFLPLCIELEEILSLFVQIFHVFKNQCSDFLKGSLWTLLTICDNARKVSDLIDYNKNEELSEDEVIDKVKTVTRLYVQLISNDIPMLVAVLLPDQLVHVLSSCIELIHSVDKPDPTLIKLCAHLFQKIITNYPQMNIKQSSKDTILYQLIYKRLLPLLIYLPSHDKFNLNDAQFNMALTEIASCQKSIALYEGSQFLQYLQSQCLPDLRFSSDLIFQYCQAFNLPDKDFQAFLKGFYVQAKSSTR